MSGFFNAKARANALPRDPGQWYGEGDPYERRPSAFRCPRAVAILSQVNETCCMTSATTPKSDLTRSGTRRRGDDYQDVVALDTLVDWLEHSDRYRWVRVEADDFGSLDDVTAELSDGTLFVRQVKFSTHPENQEDRLTWDALLHQEAGQRGPKPSLLKKWASSLAKLTSAGQTVDAALISNRQASEDLRRSLNHHGTVDFDALTPEVRQQIGRQLGDEAKARAFFGEFKLELNRPNLTEFEAGVRRRFFRLGGTEQGWQNLKDEVGAWVCFRERPNPGGTVTLPDVKRAAQWYQLQSLPQRYEISPDYVLPSAAFHEDLIARLVDGSRGVTVLYASPGSGKSSYVSNLFEDLKAHEVPVVRHHYFLSLTDEFLALRIDHRRAAQSLMHDLLRDHAEALGGAAHRNPYPDPVELRMWLEACGAHYAAGSQQLILILDGLDHVWRERRSVDELDRLLSMLLPLPSGVCMLVAMQPVDDTMLPAGLLRAAPRDTWLELPLLGPAETKDWLSPHLADFAGFEDSAIGRARAVRVGNTLYSRSRGHPLHLRYTLRAVQERGLALDEDVLQRLPECPHGAIADYYAELWRLVPEEARQILHLFAATHFPWPRDGITACLDPEFRAAARIFEALKQVEHLLRYTDLGLRPFHGSLLAFVSLLPEHDSWAPNLKQKALHWLRGSAPEYWKWAYTWRLAADLGDEKPLLDGPDRAWAVDAISKFRPAAEVQDVLVRALACTAQRHDFPRAIQLGLLQGYYADAIQPHQTALGPMLFVRLLITDEPTLRHWLRTRVDELTDEQIHLLAESEVGRDNTSQTHRYLDILDARLREDGERRKSQVAGHGVYRLAPLLAVAALRGGLSAASVVRYAAATREQGYSARIVSIFAEQLAANHDFSRLRALLDPVPPDTDGQDSITLTSRERGAAISQLALLALQEQTNCDDVALVEPASALLQIYAAIRKTPAFQPTDVTFPATTVLSVKEYELYQCGQEMDALLTDAFFAFLANHLWERGNLNRQWLAGLGGSPWPFEFMGHLDDVARDLAASLRAGRPLRLGEFHAWVCKFPPPEFRGNLNREEFQYGQAAVRSVMAISLDLIIPLSAGAGVPILTKEDMEAVSTSAYFFRDSWIRRYVASRRTWLTDDALDWLLRQGEHEMESSVGQFPERAERYAELAALAALHGWGARAESLLTQAAENLLAHGFHKDMLLSHVLDAISAYQRERPVAERHAGDHAAHWVRRLAPPIAHITEFTDGDHTRHLPGSLANTIAEVASELLPAYYQWLAGEEKYYNAQEAFEVFVRTADLADPVVQAIVQTATDDASLRALAERSRSGDQRAAEALTALLAVMGQSVIVQKPPEPRSAEPDHLLEQSKLPPVDEYSPERLSDFLAALNSATYWRQRDAVATWANYWAAHGQGREAYSALMDASDRGHISSAWDTIYQLATQYGGRESAYVFLVQAYREANLWSRFWASDEQASKYWEAVKTHYPTHWARFLADTILENTASGGPALGHDAFKRLVLYCLMMGQRSLASQLVETMVNGSLELVSPLQLAIPGWAADEQSS